MSDNTADYLKNRYFANEWNNDIIAAIPSSRASQRAKLRDVILFSIPRQTINALGRFYHVALCWL